MTDPSSPGEPKPCPGIQRRRLDRTVQIAAWLYLAASVLFWLFLEVAGDRWWGATLIMFGPRWLWALPLGLLLPLAVAFNRRALWFLGCSIVVVVGPIMGLCINVPQSQSTGPGLHLRVLTNNTQGERLDLQAMASLIGKTHPDIVTFQEWLPGRPVTIFDDHWNVILDADFVLASRFPIRTVRVSFDQHAAQRRGATVAYDVQTPDKTIRFFSVHLTSPHAVFRNALELKRHGRAQVTYNSKARGEEAADLRQQADAFDGPLLLAGDFNLPSDSTIFRKYFSSFTDSFSTAGFGFGWTYYERWTVTRIDHILAGPGWTCQRCWIGPADGSDHRPLIADLSWLP
jgi:endonuclease/exonuclease/phosphatase (EEP) superfamily protein YafD